MVTAIVTVPASGSARALYVSPDGDDKASGTIERPWRTLRASLGRLEPGDTLNLYGGRYFEDGLILDARGTTEQPIVIRSASGDRCWIGAEGGVFIKAKSGTWQSVDEAKKIYRLKNPPPSKVTSKLTGGWLWVREKIQLVPYTDQKLFASSNSGVKGYIGPGFFLDKRELRVRLEMPKVPSDSPSVAGGVPSIESDPDLHNFFFCSGKGPTLTVRKAAHIVLENLDFEPSGRRTIEITGDSHHVTINDCSVLVRTLGIVAQEGTHDLAIRNCTFQMGFPPWVAWGDVKGGSRGAGFNPAEEAGWNSFAIVGAWKSSVIEHCTFLDCFDGIFLRAGSENVVVSNNSILRSRDDAIDLAPNVSKIEISHNLIWRCFEGISLVGEKGGKNAAGKKAKGESAGEVFIHHNVIDVSARHFAERKEDAAYFSSEWSAGIAFGRQRLRDGALASLQQYDRGSRENEDRSRLDAARDSQQQSLRGPRRSRMRSRTKSDRAIRFRDAYAVRPPETNDPIGRSAAGVIRVARVRCSDSRRNSLAERVRRDQLNVALNLTAKLMPLQLSSISSSGIE
jgi:hypothetical protein